MRWYFAINEAGSAGDLGLHAKLAVVSARRVGGLDPVLLYLGARNAFTAWMDAAGVRVIDAEPGFADAIRAAVAAGRYPPDFAGHWLRSAICLTDWTEELALYTDCDVVFLRPLDLPAGVPAYFACAPEFEPDNWNYFNSGVMLMNLAALRDSYAGFDRYIRTSLAGAESAGFNDQLAYNSFYRGHWSRLDPVWNWKPYWGLNPAARILHFHGPKLGAIRRILDGDWNWQHEHERQIGSLFVSAMVFYAGYLRILHALFAAELPEAGAAIGAALDRFDAFAATAPRERVDLAFTRFRLFPEMPSAGGAGG